MRISDWSSDVCSSDLLAESAGLESLDRGLRGSVRGRHAPPQFGRVRIAFGEHARRAEYRLQHQGARGIRGQAFGERGRQIGRASGREKVWQYGLSSVGAVALKKKLI